MTALDGVVVLSIFVAALALGAYLDDLWKRRQERHAYVEFVQTRLEGMSIREHIARDEAGGVENLALDDASLSAATSARHIGTHSGYGDGTTLIVPFPPKAG